MTFVEALNDITVPDYSFYDYQVEAVQTLGPDRDARSLALGVVGEAGEVALEIHDGVSINATRIAELVKKAHRPNKTINLDLLKAEIGDELWYLAVLADTYDLDLEEIALDNIDKLKKRYPA